jgi:hypothetical protein
MEGEPETTLCICPDGRITTLLVVDGSEYAHLPVKVCEAVECTEGLIHSWASLALEHTVQGVVSSLHQQWRRRRHIKAFPKGFLRSQKFSLAQHCIQVFRQTKSSRKALEAMQLMLESTISSALLTQAYAQEETRVAARRVRRKI